MFYIHVFYVRDVCVSKVFPYTRPDKKYISSWKVFRQNEYSNEF